MRPTGTTAMDKGISLAVQLAQQATTGSDLDLVLLTDGYPDSGPRTLQAADKAKSQGVTLSTLGRIATDAKTACGRVADT